MSDSLNSSSYKISSRVQLDSFPTIKELPNSKKQLEKTREKLGELQDTLYAHGKYGVLVCLQGMDTAGKDSLIREVFKDFNARGVVVHSFKQPTSKELRHDYLWRHYVALPERGKFSVFNRTHYENVLVTRVHPEYILGEGLPHVHTVDDVNDAFWDRRFDQINAFEKHIAANGILVFKFFLHLSKDEQRNRLLRRLEKKEKNWKFSAGDLKERRLWDDYQHCYEDVINRTSKPHAPWYIIPADNKPEARLLVASILLEELQKFKDIKEPELDKETKENLEIYKQQLENE